MSTSGFQVNENAPAFYHRLVGQFMRPFVTELITRAVQPSDHVLDVACGTGFASLAAGDVANDQGSVTGLDINPDMLAYARTHDSTVSWVQSSAMEMPFADASFDCVISQQGIQFFLDTVAGLREMHRVTKPGGRLAATVWSPMTDTPLLHEETEMLIEVGGLDESAARAVWVEDASVLEGWVTTAGFRDVQVERLVPIVELPPLEDYIPDHLRALPWSGPFFELPQATREAAIQKVIEPLERYATETGAALPFSSFVATGIK